LELEEGFPLAVSCALVVVWLVAWLVAGLAAGKAPSGFRLGREAGQARQAGWAAEMHSMSIIIDVRKSKKHFLTNF
jgi:type II secretory pathway component PulK